MTRSAARPPLAPRPAPVSGVTTATAARTPEPWLTTGVAGVCGAAAGALQLSTADQPPVLAKPIAQGSATAAPVLPPIETDAAIELPVEPLTASPEVELAAAPELPPVAVPSLAPDAPENAMSGARPATVVGAEVTSRVTSTSPVSPEDGSLVAAPPSPEPALEDGVFEASPELPVVPEVASEELDDEPEPAAPVAVGLAVASPVPPPLPVEPVVMTAAVEVAAAVVTVAEAVPVPPDTAVPMLTGLAVADPVLPPVDVDDAIELPVAPEMAFPEAELVAGPELPPVAVEVTFPELPEIAMTTTDPGPNDVFDAVI